MGSSPSSLINQESQILQQINSPNQESYHSSLLKENIHILSKVTLSEDEIDNIITILRKQFFSQGLHDQLIKQLAGKFKKAVHTKQFDWLFKEGSHSNYLFILNKGKVDVVKDGYFIRSLVSGDFFGELSLLYGIKRSSSIKIPKQFKNKNEYFVLSKQQFQEFILRSSSQVCNQSIEIVRHYFPFKYLAVREHNKLIKSVFRISFSENRRIFTRYDQPYALFFIVEGQVRTSYPNRPQIYLKNGESFGYHGSQRSDFSAITSEPCRCLAIGKQSIDQILKDSLVFLLLECRLKQILLWNIYLKDLSIQRINRIITKFKFRKMNYLEPICKVRDLITRLYVPITCQKTENQNQIYGISEFNKKQRYFSHDLVALQKGYVAYIQVDDYNQIIQYSETSKFLLLNFNNVKPFNISECEEVRCLRYNKHGQAIELLYRQSRYKKQFVQKKYEFQQDDQFNKTTLILKSLDSHFIRSYYCYRSDFQCNYLYLEHISGLSLEDFSRNTGTIPVHLIRFYLSIIIIITQDLHKIAVVNRNWSLSDYILDQKGYLWLMSVEKSKSLNVSAKCQSLKSSYCQIKKTKTLVNVPYAYSPEMALKEQYGLEADFWGIGILLYLMITGQYPFGNDKKDPILIYEAILNDSIKYPINIKSKEIREILNTLLIKDKKIREGQRISDIKDMEFFKGIEWSSLRKIDIESPYLPIVTKYSSI